MQQVLALIETKKQEFAQLPLFSFMQNQSIHPKDRLCFAPLIVPLAMGFGELCNYVFREEPTTNKVQSLLNRHTYEEHFHWQWLLEDLEKLELHHCSKLTDAMLFSFGDATLKSRNVCYQLHHHSFQADPIVKFAAMQVAEATANVFFNVSQPVALELKAITGKEYRYFGMCHLHEEEHHHINTPNIVSFFQQIELNDQQRQQALLAVEAIFTAYTEAMNSFLDFAKQQMSTQQTKILLESVN
ncbi:hypothetical protein H6G74_11205 [Nostoc spongiaeforme FACHB-130]|uniref:Iron-containing redox enzyme family protein n=1 Tax=Nostoc spongiaeforme FACHB-130 TaxID=1357510 RepID=A0ABR8FU31_9NOSO|nr:hypothetical protein [Nostoc spongiaeforme]MBD2594893.1 hypothetical protein [Nostoc spongiaeforme FACHB-130]